MRRRAGPSTFFRHSSFLFQFPFNRLVIASIGLAVCVGGAFSFAQQGASAQAQSIPSMITQPVNDARRIILKGNVHPLARPGYDHGLAPDSLPMDRMLLVLKRSPQQEAALEKLLFAQQEKSSPEYHHWLAPKAFGQEFGPSDADIQAVTDWLASQGFQVNRVSNGRTVIEFSGSAGLVRQVFRAEIHKYVIKGKSYWANSSDPQIPAALAPVVAGIASLNDFPRKPLYRPVGVFSRSKKTGKIKPLYTFNCPSGYTCSAPAYYALGPTDFATIYNVLPLWNAGTDGTGETIAIVSDSNINPQDVANFRSMFGLPAKPVNVILNGPDPGINPGSETEADADTEWAGAVAKNATIDLVVSEDTETTAGIDLSALYIIDNDIAPVLSESYGACESDLGNAGNAFENAMWQQAAAEGITVVVSAGDTGSAGCDNPNLENAAQNGLAVNGLGSSPFNVAVGGTDLDDPSSYFTTTNDPTTQSSAKSYVPEITWNDSCARASQTTGCWTVSSYGEDLVAGGGGESNCAVQDSSGNCTFGYSKPVWQTGTGVPADGLRDIPDVSLFAGDGLDNAFYIVCSSDQANLIDSGSASCANDMSTLDFLGVGGTSLAAPAFAGVMALVDQKASLPQGDANFVLYPFAAAAAKNGDDCASSAAAVSDSSCIFYDINTGHNGSGTDITPGSNSVACVAGSPDCVAPGGYPYGILTLSVASTTPAWTTAAGYDLATGLGSVNAANLVNNWASVSFHSSGTTLSLSPTTLTHGQSVSATISVTSSAGTPSGDVELMGNPVTAGNPGGGNIGIATFKLGSGGTVSGTTDMLPGGTYSVYARYAGDGTSGSSNSTPVQVTVSPESSQPRLSFMWYNPITGALTGPNPTPPSDYSSSFYFSRVDILNSAGDPCAPTTSDGLQVQPTSGCPTGTVTLTDNGSPLNDFNGSDSATLNSQGYLEDQQFPILAGGSHSLVTSYSGDASFNPSSNTANFTINPAPTTLTINQTWPARFGSSASFDATINTTSFGVGPTGTVTFFVDGTLHDTDSVESGNAYNKYTQTYAVTYAEDTVTFWSVGQHTFSAEYSGNTNYQAAASTVLNVTVTKYQPSVWVNPTPSNIGLGQQTTLEAQVAGAIEAVASQDVAPTGTVSFSDGGTAISGTVTYSSSGSTLTATIPYTPTTVGTGSVTATYSGDSNYLSATGSATLAVETPDFQLLSNQSPTIAVPGGSASAQIGILSWGGWTGTVKLACTVSTEVSGAQKYMPTCSLNPASVNVGSTQVSSTLTVHTIAPSSAPPAPRGEPPAGRWPLGFWLGMLILVGMAALALSRTRKGLGIRSAFRWALPVLLATVLLGVALWGSCGGGGGGGGSTVTNSGTPAGNYTVTVTGVSGNLQHQVEVTFSVQ